MRELQYQLIVTIELKIQSLGIIMGLYKKLMNDSIYQRKDMPQIKHKDLKKAFKKLEDNGIRIKTGKAKPSEWKPSQKDIYKSKVKKMINDPRMDNPEKMKPFIISRDNYIVDGHHRWAAVMKAHPDYKFKYYKIDLPIQQAVEVYNKIADYLK